MPKTGKPKIPVTPEQEPLLPPTAVGPEAVKAREDVKARQRKAKGRRATRLTTPGTLAISDVNILRPQLTEKLAPKL